MTASDTEHNEDTDIEISEKIEENGCIEQLGYDRFIRLCILFTSEAVLHGEHQSPPAADLQHALDFLDGKTTAAALDSRRDSAWRDHDKLNRQNDPAAAVRRLTLTFLFPDLLRGIEEKGQPDSYDFLFLNLLWDIDPALCHRFWDYLSVHIEAA